jgi:hypothetical protein
MRKVFSDRAKLGITHKCVITYSLSHLDCHCSAMFESNRDQMRCGKDRDFIDKQHTQISSLIKRQSEQDFPRGLIINGLIDGTNISLLNEREIFSGYFVLYIIQQMEVAS